MLGAGDRPKSPLHHRAAGSEAVGADGPRRRRPDSDRPLRVGPPVQCRCIFTVPEGLLESCCVSPRVSSRVQRRARGATVTPAGSESAVHAERRTRRPLAPRPAHGRDQAWRRPRLSGPGSMRGPGSRRAAAAAGAPGRGHLRGGSESVSSAYFPHHEFNSDYLRAAFDSPGPQPEARSYYSVLRNPPP